MNLIKPLNARFIGSLNRVQAAEYLQIRAERLRWIIGLRWPAMVGLAFAGIMAQLTGYAVPDFVLTWSLVPLLVLVNFSYLYVLQRSLKANLPLAQLERSLRWQSYAQATGDALLLALLIYLSGGVESPYMTAIIFAIVIDAILLSGFEIFFHANLAAFLLALFFYGEYSDLLPQITYLAPQYEQGLAQDIPAMLGRLLSMTVLLNVTAFLCLSLIGRLDRLEIRTRRMLAQMREQVLSASQQLADSSAGLSQGASDVNLAAGQMASTVQQIAQGAASQAAQLENISHNLEGMAANSRSMAHGAEETHHAATETVSLGRSGCQAAQDATARMQEIAQLFSQTEQALQSLAQRSKEIGDIASAIDRFAERTDLLALNAGIEAARAGEHGRGFAVVAGEVKKLATSSSNSAIQVAEMTLQIQDSLQSVSTLMRSGNSRLADGLKIMTVVQQAVENMSAVIVQTEQLAEGMEGLSQQQLEAYQQIVNAVGEIASAAEQTAAGAEQAAAVVEEQAATMTDFSHAVDQLAQLAGKLEHDVAGLTDTASAPTSAAAGVLAHGAA